VASQPHLGPRQPRWPITSPSTCPQRLLQFQGSLVLRYSTDPWERAAICPTVLIGHSLAPDAVHFGFCQRCRLRDCGQGCGYVGCDPLRGPRQLLPSFQEGDDPHRFELAARGGGRQDQAKERTCERSCARLDLTLHVSGKAFRVYGPTVDSSVIEPCGSFPRGSRSWRRRFLAQ
jgi:hypothetical protein